MNDPIVECDFHMEACKNRANRPEKEGGYKVYVNFYSDAQKTHLVSTRKLTITKEPQTPPRSGNPVYDIYSYNGQTGSARKPLLGKQNFSSKKIRECLATIAVFNQLQSPIDQACQILFVLDLKQFTENNEHATYANRQSIEASEQEMLNFLSSGNQAASSKAHEFRTLLLSTAINYVILEGGLKAAFLEEDFLSEAEKQFLQTRGTGCVSFCQLIEFFLNAFKRGEEVTLKIGDTNTPVIQKKTYGKAPYLKKLNETAPDYVPTEISHTLYPAAYYDIATTGIYTSSMQNSTLFHTKTIEHDHQVVEMITTLHEVRS
jgi:hypothetical protein